LFNPHFVESYQSSDCSLFDLVTGNNPGASCSLPFSIVFGRTLYRASIQHVTPSSAMNNQVLIDKLVTHTRGTAMTLLSCHNSDLPEAIGANIDSRMPEVGIWLSGMGLNEIVEVCHTQAPYTGTPSHNG
jgi:hypothetical protein